MSLNIDDAGYGVIGHGRGFETFRIDQSGFILSIGHHLNTSVTAACLIRTISLQGADLEVVAGTAIAPNFFLSILGIRDRIGATLVHRERNELAVSFNMLIDPDFLHHVVRVSVDAAR
jgi:hypothetical protein